MRGFILGFVVATLFYGALIDYYITQAADNGTARVFAECSKTGATQFHGVKMTCTVGVKEVRYEIRYD